MGVCRDFALLAVAFCRALNIPARYTFGYLPDIAVEPPDVPMDFHAWFEAYLGDRWYTFDARHNAPRIGRVVIGRGRDAVDVALTTSFGADPPAPDDGVGRRDQHGRARGGTGEQRADQPAVGTGSDEGPRTAEPRGDLVKGVGQGRGGRGRAALGPPAAGGVPGPAALSLHLQRAGHDVRQRLMMIPPERHGDQRLLEHELTCGARIDGYAVRWERDRFGNRVGLVSAARVAHIGGVRGHATAWSGAGRAGRRRAGVTLDEARRVMLEADRPDGAGRAPAPAAAGIAARGALPPASGRSAAATWAAGAIVYQIGVTGVQTPGRDGAAPGAGACARTTPTSCSACCACWTCPARYVSGHLLGEGAPHAWVEALLEDRERHRRGGRRRLRPDPPAPGGAGATSRSPSGGTSPTSRPPRARSAGAATGRLSASKQAEVVEQTEAATPTEGARSRPGGRAAADHRAGLRRPDPRATIRATSGTRCSQRRRPGAPALPRPGPPARHASPRRTSPAASAPPISRSRRAASPSPSTRARRASRRSCPSTWSRA